MLILNLKYEKNILLKQKSDKQFKKKQKSGFFYIRDYPCN